MTTRRQSISFEGLRMSQERTVARGPELGRWLLVGALLLVGLALFFIYAPGSEPPAPPTTAHEGP
jgi:hypothetical protein